MEMDPDGNVRLHGRIKDIINRGVVQSAEVEAVIASHPAVARCFDEPNTRRAKAAKFMWPEKFEIVPDMPTTPTRKIIKPNWCMLTCVPTARPAA
jgi:non-ribosomal peptide synthetase component E (peptide arylation enzyme)